jgi:hypothetical protein
MLSDDKKEEEKKDKDKPTGKVGMGSTTCIINEGAGI